MRVVEFVSTMGPSRRAEVTVVEMVLQAEASEASQFDEISRLLQLQLPAKLSTLGINLDAQVWAEIEQGRTAIARLAAYVCHLALALQNAAGHALQFEDFLQDQDPATQQARYRLIFQHDDIPSGEQAGDLAMRILAEVCPQLHWQVLLHDADLPLAGALENFLAFTRPLVTPAETWTLMAAAKARQIPVLRLEREPYGDLPASFRVAPNGIIMLGHSRHRVILDGLFSISRPEPGFTLMKDRRAMWSLVAELGAAGPIQDWSLMVAGSPTRARRAARRLGYPLRLRPLQRNPQAVDGWRVDNEAALERMLSWPIFSNSSFMLEPELAGPVLDLLFVGDTLYTALQDGHRTTLDPVTESLAKIIALALDCGVLLIRFKPGAAAQNTHHPWVLTDLDPSPKLESLLAKEPQLLANIYDRLLDWLYPPGSQCRIPIVAVTGTNGKTTTSTMIARMARAESLFVGMARTTGVYFDIELKEFGDRSGFLGHCLVFENDKVDLAVLETARGDVLRAGFAYDLSNVAVCTNVTADHLGEHGVETVEDMAVVKRSILERCIGSVVLNGDDALCIQMLPYLPGRKIYLSTFLHNPAEVRARTKSAVSVIHLKQQQGEDWIVLDETNQSTPIIAVNSIPATFMGAAQHNISNAMHAIAAGHALGFSTKNIRQALEQFEMSYDSLPGRLNVHDNGRFHIIMDYAHNADGIRQLTRFTDRYPCSGRKILRFGVSPQASEAAALAAAAAAAGHFDHYICSGKPGADPTQGLETTAILRRGLLENGVTESQVELFDDPTRSVEYPVSLCQPGDLLVMVTSNVGLATTWESILKT